MTKHERILADLEQRIAAREYGPAGRIPTEMELCAAYGAARATVAKALRELELRGLIERRRRAGTFVRAGHAVQSRTVGLLVPGLGEGEIFEPICSSIAAEAARFGFRLSWRQLPALPAAEKARAAMALCQRYIDDRVDGLFFEPLELTGEKDEINLRILDLLRQAGIPVVLIDADPAYPERSGLDLAGIDNFRAGVVLAEHLLARGCRSLAFVHRPRSAGTTQARAAGFRAALAARGLPVTDRVLEAEPDAPGLVPRLTGRLQVDGIVCANDYTAACLMRNLQAAGLRMPEQIRLTGVDNVKYAQLLSVPLTTLAQPCREIGLAALELMRFRIARPDAPPRQILLDAPLIPRHSSV